MKYEFVISGIYNREPLFTFECQNGIHMGQDELDEKNYILAMCPNASGDKIRVVLAKEPKVISLCEMKWVYIGEPVMKHEIIWPTNESLEKIAEEVSEVTSDFNFEKNDADRWKNFKLSEV